MSPLGKAFFVQTFKDLTFYVQCPNQQKEEPDKKKKLRTAKTILNKILWSSLNKDDFTVGYVDNEFGLIEMSAGDLELFDVKEGRVKYFKKNGMIIWDR